MLTFARWGDLFGDQVSKMREARTGQLALLHDAELERIPDMWDALHCCWVAGVRPKVAAQRYVALVDG